MLDRPNAVVVVMLHLFAVRHTQIGNTGTDPKTKIGKKISRLDPDAQPHNQSFWIDSDSIDHFGYSTGKRYLFFQDYCKQDTITKVGRSL